MEDLTNRWRSLSLTKEEEAKVDLTRDKKIKGAILAVKFFTRRNANVEAVAKTFRPIWQTRGNFEVCKGKENVLLIAFQMEADAKKVVQGQPWAFDRHLVVVQQYDGSVPIQDLVFKTTTFWIQIHNLPFQLLTMEVALDIGGTIGAVSWPKDLGEMKGGNFMRVRVEVDITKLLYKGRKISWDHSGTIPNFEEALNDIDDTIRNGPRIPISKAAASEIMANQIDSSSNLIDIEIMVDDLGWETQA
ncbi:hypothetical protein SO802_034612 [Lithocarpus litseifolius]|uniref:DUF4283 domain-containing protein n=1 Tax=Lithocarpus litseifolius TaxID=425828 RepID=A0AAW2BIZ7_9ROSI